MVIGVEDPMTTPSNPYPNPADSELFIELDGTATARDIQLFDYLGRSRPISIEQLDGRKYKCLVSELPQGMYVLFLRNIQMRRTIVIAH